MPGKYLPIVEILRRELMRQPAGARFLSESQVAVRFGVSRPTAARVLRELTDAGLLERRVGSGTYVRGADQGVAAPVPAAGRRIGLILAGLGSTEVWDPFARHIGQAGSALGMSVLQPEASPRDDADAAAAQAAWLLDQGVDGVLFAPLEAVSDREAANRAILGRLTDAGVQAVLLDRDLTTFPTRSGFDVVGMDNVRAGALIGGHLAAAGLHRVTFVSYPGFPDTTDLRGAGIRWALAAAGVQVRPDWHVQGDPTDEAWVRAMLAEHRPTVVACSNDRTAALLLQALMRLGTRVPRDVAVTGFDDVVYSRLLPVALTTVVQPIAAIARTAVRRLADRIARPDLEACELLLPPELVVRESTAGATRAR